MPEKGVAASFKKGPDGHGKEFSKWGGEGPRGGL